MQQFLDMLMSFFVTEFGKFPVRYDVITSTETMETTKAKVSSGYDPL